MKGVLAARFPLGLVVAVPLCVLGAISGCDGDALKQPTAGSASGFAPSALPPELAQKPLAKVGDKVITLGDYAATLDRMDQFERLRYQSPERRKQLLDEIIEVELLAHEARRNGLHEDPEVRDRIRQMLRDEVLKKLREDLPSPGDIPQAEIRAYYDQHRAEFREPERRRVAHIALSDRAKAQKVLEQAKSASPEQWGKLVRDHSADKSDKPSATAPAELAGDLGIVSPPGDARGKNPRVPEPLRKAVFAIDKIGSVYPELVEHDGKFHIVRMTGKTDARDRSYAEAERNIRITLLQKKQEDAQKKLEAELRQRFAVKVDDKALEKLTVPQPESTGGAAPAPNEP